MSDPTQISDVLALLESAYGRGKGNYPDGMRDGLQNFALLLANRGVAPRLLYEAAVDVFVTYAKGIRGGPAMGGRTSEGNPQGASPFGAASLTTEFLADAQTRVLQFPRRESTTILTADGYVRPPLRGIPRMGELTDEQRDIDTDKARDAMTLEYEAWMKHEGLNLSSADEHLFDPKLTLAQLEWVREFAERWDHNEQIASLQHELKRTP